MRYGCPRPTRGLSGSGNNAVSVKEVTGVEKGRYEAIGR